MVKINFFKTIKFLILNIKVDMKNKIENNQNSNQLNILVVIISFLNILRNILGWIVFIISIPFLCLGIIGWFLLCSLKYFGIPMGEDDDIYLSGPFRGFPKN